MHDVLVQHGIQMQLGTLAAAEHRPASPRALPGLIDSHNTACCPMRPRTGPRCFGDLAGLYTGLATSTCMSTQH
jgi:hypothetical protein